MNKFFPIKILSLKLVAIMPATRKSSYAIRKQGLVSEKKMIFYAKKFSLHSGMIVELFQSSNSSDEQEISNYLRRLSFELECCREG